MTAFATVPDEGVRDAMNLHFGIITGLTDPKPKGKGANIEEWKAQFSFINVFAFRAAFMEATSRGICSPAEIMAGNEILAITG